MVGAGAVEGVDDWTANTVGHTTTGRFTNPDEGIVVVDPADEEVVAGAAVAGPLPVVVVVPWVGGDDVFCVPVECPIRNATTATMMTTMIAPLQTMDRLLTEKVTFSGASPEFEVDGWSLSWSMAISDSHEPHAGQQNQ